MPSTGRSRAGVWFVAAVALQSAAPLLVTPVLARSVTAGTLAALLSTYYVAVVLGSVADLAVSATITRTILRDPGDAGPRALRLSLAISTCFLMVVVTIYLLLRLLLGDVATHIHLAALTLAGLTAVNTSLLGVDRALGRARSYFVSALAAPGIGLLAVAGVATQTDSTTLMLMVWLISCGLAVLAHWIATAPAMGGASRLDRSFVTSQLGFALPVVPHVLGATLMSNGPRLVAGLTLPTADAGLVLGVLLVATAPSVLVNGINNLWAPSVYRVADDDRVAYISRTRRRLLAAFGAIAVLNVAASPATVWIVTDHSPSLESTLLVALGSSAVWPQLFYLAATHSLFSLRKTGIFAVASPVAAGLSTLVALGTARIAPVLSAGFAILCGQTMLALLVARRARETDGLRSPVVRSTALLLILLACEALAVSALT